METLEPRRLLSATMVADVYSGPVSSSPTDMTQVGDTLYFRANDPVNGAELWSSDGTAAGTHLVKDIWPGLASSGPADLTNVNNTLFFTATDGAHGTELWMSDGTETGTKMVKNINGNSTDSAVQNLIAFNGKLYFSANNGANGQELWVSDGTDTGTKMLRDINFGLGGSAPRNFCVVGDTLYFSADDGLVGRELWQTDGTDGGTQMVLDINMGGNGDPQDLTAFDNKLYFSADDGDTGRELWVSDGTPGGTQLVKDISLGDSDPWNLTAVGERLYFSANDGTNGRELWMYKSGSGAQLVWNINGGSADSDPQNLINVNGYLLFTATDGVTGRELWLADPFMGPTRITDINEGGASSNPQHLTNINGTLYFNAEDGKTGMELWKMKGFVATQVADIQPGSSGSNPKEMIDFNGQLYFSANDGNTGYELWTVNPITAVAGNYTVNEGGSVKLSAAGSRSDADPSTLTYEWDLDGDSIYGETGDAAAHGDETGMTPTFVAGDLNGPDTQKIALTVTDADGNSDIAGGTITIDNVVPTIDPIEAITGQEGKEVKFTATFIDPGPETHTAMIDWSDGTPSESVEVIQSDSGGWVSASHVYEEEGEYWPVLTVSDGSVPEARRRFTITIKKEAPPVLAIGDRPGDGSHIHIQRTDGTDLDITAFDGFEGGVNVTSGDVNGDGVADIIAAAGAGGSSHIRIFNGSTGEQIDSPLGSFVAFAGAGGSVTDSTSTYWTGAYNGPVQVASGDFDGDGVADLAVAAGRGGSSHVKIFNGADGSLMQSFLAFGGGTDASDPAYFANAFQGGVNVSTGDIDGDGLADLIVGAGPGAGPHVKVFADGNPARLVRSFFAYDPGFAGGVNVAGGDVNGDGRDDILTAPQSNAGPHVVAFSGIDNTLLQSFWAFDPAYAGGVKLSGADYNGDGFFDLYATQTGGSGESRLYDFSSGVPQQKAVEDFFNIV